MVARGEPNDSQLAMRDTAERGAEVGGPITFSPSLFPGSNLLYLVPLSLCFLILFLFLGPGQEVLGSDGVTGTVAEGWHAAAAAVTGDGPIR